MKVAGFDWDEGNLEKCQKHGVSIEEIEAVFSGMPSVLLNQNHDSDEVRYHAVGQGLTGRYIFVVFTERKLDKVMLIRPISARFMHRKEISNYVRQKKA